MPIQRSVIANFENGRRASIGVAELLAFAAVLKIPPVWLIAPMGFEADMEILPGVTADPYASAVWVSGGGVVADQDEQVYEDNPMPLLDDLQFLLEQIQECRSKVEELRPAAQEKAPELARIDEQLERLRQEFFHHAEQQKSVLEQIKAMEDEGRLADATDEMFAEAERSYRRMDECNEKIQELSERRTSVLRDTAGLEIYRDHLDRYEKEAREVLAEFRAKGLRPPKLPDSLAYLLEEPRREELPPVHVRRRKRDR